MPRTQLRLREHAAFKPQESHSKAVGSSTLSSVSTWLTFTRSTGQRLRCPDDPTCNYFTFDKSALLRHRQRRHEYKTRSTAPKNRHAKKVPKKCGATDGDMDASHKLDSRNPDLTECPCLLSSDCRTAGTMDETHISQDNRVHVVAVEQPVGSTHTPLEEHAITRFPTSFTRTHLPAVSKHCPRCTCKGRSNPRPIARSKGVNPDAVSCPVSVICRQVESFAKKSFFISPMVAGNNRLINV